MLTRVQLRAARALVKWSREHLADKSGVAAGTIKEFELMRVDTKISTLNKMRIALELAGVEFIDEGAKSEEGGHGVRLRGRTLTSDEIAELHRKKKETSPYYRRAFAHLRPKT